MTADPDPYCGYRVGDWVQFEAFHRRHTGKVVGWIERLTRPPIARIQVGNSVLMCAADRLPQGTRAQAAE